MWKLSRQHRWIQTAALRFLFVKMLKRRYLLERHPVPEIAAAPAGGAEPGRGGPIDRCGSNLRHRTILMTLYSTGMRRSELCHLRTEDIDKERMVIHIRQGKGGKDRDVPLSPKLLDQLCAITGAG